MPVLVNIDIQKEYETEGRSYWIRGIQSSLQNAKKILGYARKKDWKVYHVRHIQDGDLFGNKSPYSQFIAGFEPKPGEAEFVKSDYSCYSLKEFVERLGQSKKEDVVITGYGSTKCCLATIIDGYHRGQRFIFVSDASCAKRSEQFDEESLHKHAVDIISSFAKVVSTSEILEGKIPVV